MAEMEPSPSYIPGTEPISFRLNTEPPVNYAEEFERLTNERTQLQNEVAERLADEATPTTQRLTDEMNQAIERVNEIRARQQGLLESIDLGTLSDEYKWRMQRLAGIYPVTQNITSERAKLDDVPSEQPVKVGWFRKLINKVR